MARDVYEGIVALRNPDGLLVPLSGVRVSVFNRGTTTLATIYQAPTGASQGPTPGAGATNGPNPFTTGPSGAMEFWCDGPSTYDVLIHDLQGPPRLSDRTFGWNCFPADDAVIVTRMLGDIQVTTAKIADSAISNTKLANLSVSTGKIQDNAVTTLKIPDSAIATAKIQDSSVTSAKILDSAVTSAKIQNNAITSAKITDGTVTDADLAAPNNSIWRTLLHGRTIIGGGSGYSLNEFGSFYWDPAAYVIPGKTIQWRLLIGLAVSSQATGYTNTPTVRARQVAGAGASLIPLTYVGADIGIVQHTVPAGSAGGNASAAFAPPAANGLYAITGDGNSIGGQTFIFGMLQMRHI